VKEFAITMFGDMGKHIYSVVRRIEETWERDADRYKEELIVKSDKPFSDIEMNQRISPMGYRVRESRINYIGNETTFYIDFIGHA
jgi:hypothetical protein